MYQGHVDAFCFRALETASQQSQCLDANAVLIGVVGAEAEPLTLVLCVMMLI